MWSAVIVLGLTLVFAHAQSPARGDSQVGRYQVVAAPQDSISGVEVFRLDTVTGKTWIKIVLPEDGAKISRWALLPDYAPPK